MDFRKLKGNLGLKSSALAPTACKLSSQFLVLDHMSNHYMKIAKAKSAIDSRPPKSLSTSQKMRDRMNRDRIVKSPLSHSQSSMSGVTMHDFEDVLKDEPEDEQEKLVHSIMKSTLLDKSGSSNNATYRSASYGNVHNINTHMPHQVQNVHYTLPYGTVTYDHPTSLRSIKSGHSLASSSSRVAIPTNLSVNRTCNGDVLEKRPHLFTEPERPFTPRTLKKNTESRLKHSKCYNPPRTKHGVHRESNPEGDINRSQKLQSPPRTRRHKKGKEYSKNYLQDTMNTSQLSDSLLMDITLRSSDALYGQNVNHNVPPLAITMDKDHMNWLQEQANKAEVRVRSSGRLKSSLHPDEELHPKQKYHISEQYGKQDIGTEKQNNSFQSLWSYRSLLLRTSPLWISQRLMAEDEEQKYLAFAKEVTDDVLSRGISTDSVLYRVFENHIERRKNDLDEVRMRKVISDLRKNLGLKESLANGQTLASLSDSNYNNKTSYELTTSSSTLQQNESSVSIRKQDFSLSDHQKSSSNKSLTVKKEHEKNQNCADSELNSSIESISTLKFGDTGDLLSTINSEASLELKETGPNRQNNESEMVTATQTLKQYEISLTAKEESGESNSGTTDHEPTVSDRDNYTHPFILEKSATAERRSAEDEKFKSGKSSVLTQINYSQRRKSMDTSQNSEISSSVTSQTNSHLRNYKKMSKDISSSETSITGATVLQGSNFSSHRADGENVSVKGYSSLERPTAKPRIRVRQGSIDTTQSTSSVTADLVTDESEESVVHGANTEKHHIRNFPTVDKQNVDKSQLENSTLKKSSKVDENADHINNHQESKEENYDYEDDYEEVIESEADSQEDDF